MGKKEEKRKTWLLIWGPSDRIHHYRYSKFTLHLYVFFGLLVRGGTVRVIVIEVSKQCVVFHHVFLPENWANFPVVVGRRGSFLPSNSGPTEHFWAVGDLFHLTFIRLANPIQGPLITDGRNSSKWTEHYKDWSKTLQMVKFQGKILWNTFEWIIL